MTQCYFLTVCVGSSVDQQSNNVTLFNLVEHISVPPGAPPPPRGILPLEVHAYFHVPPEDVGQTFELRFVLVATSGLETPSNVLTHRPIGHRYRCRTFGLPFPPVVGQYQLCVDIRRGGSATFRRQPTSWPVTIAEAEPRPRVTH